MLIINPFIILFQPPPDFLRYVVDTLNLGIIRTSDLDLVRNILEIVELIGVIFIILSIASFIYAYLAHVKTSEFVDRLAMVIQADASSLESRKEEALRKAGGVIMEKPKK